MDDGLNTVAVLRMHLEELRRTLSFVEGALAARDLGNQYIQMGTLNRPSKLTAAVSSQIERLDGYLVSDEE